MFIEIFFRQNKMELGLNNYQVRSEKAIKRFWILTQLTYLYCTFGVSDNYCNLGEGLQIAHTKSKQRLIDWVYIQAKNGISKDAIFDVLKLS